MADPIITNVDLGSVILENARFRDHVMTFAGADTMLKGTIVAKDTSTGKYVIYVKGGVTAGNGVVRGVLTEQVVAAGAGDEAVRVAIAGDFRKNRLIIDADGDASNIDEAVISLLQDVGLVPIDELDLSVLDNQ